MKNISIKIILAVTLASFFITPAYCAKKKSYAQQKQAREEKEDIEKRAKIKVANMTRKLGIKDLAGFKFGEKSPTGLTEDRITLNKPLFGSYTRVQLLYSPAAGLYQIALQSQDDYSIKDCESEVKRIMGIFSRHYKVQFSSYINVQDDGRVGLGWTYVLYSIEEEFEDCIVTISSCNRKDEGKIATIIIKKKNTK